MIPAERVMLSNLEMPRRVLLGWRGSGKLLVRMMGKEEMEDWGGEDERGAMRGLKGVVREERYLQSRMLLILFMTRGMAW